MSACHFSLRLAVLGARATAPSARLGREPISGLFSDQRKDVRFSNRPLGVKRFQTIRRHGVDVARGLVLLFGIGTRALPTWDSRTGRNNLPGGLTVNRTAGPSGHANSPHP